jgi:hypothetical protein
LDKDKLIDEEKKSNSKSAYGMLQYIPNNKNKETRYAMLEKLRYGKASLKSNLISIILDEANLPKNCQVTINTFFLNEMWDTEDEERKWLSGHLPTVNMSKHFNGDIGASIEVSGDFEDDELEAYKIQHFVKKYKLDGIFKEISVGKTDYRQSTPTRWEKIL